MNRTILRRSILAIISAAAFVGSVQNAKAAPAPLPAPLICEIMCDLAYQYCCMGYPAGCETSCLLAYNWCLMSECG